MARQKYLVDETKVVAVLVNPKTRELVEVHRNRSASVRLHYPGDKDAFSGTAYWDSDETFDFNGDEYRRSHSPSAGVTQGKGYGVVLYSGLCLRAFSDTHAMGIASSDGGSGHSTRSSSADAFWSRAVSNDLAQEDYTEGSETRTYEDDGEDYNYGGCERVPDEDCEEVENVHGSIEIEYTAAGGEVEAQYMNAEENLAESGLIFALPGMKVELDFAPPNADVLASLDLKRCYSVGLAELVIDHAFREGFDLPYIQRLVNTLPLDVYNQTSASKQLKFDFVSNSRKQAMTKEINQVWKSAYGGLVDMG